MLGFEFRHLPDTRHVLSLSQIVWQDMIVKILTDLYRSMWANKHYPVKLSPVYWKYHPTTQILIYIIFITCPHLFCFSVVSSSWSEIEAPFPGTRSTSSFRFGFDAPSGCRKDEILQPLPAVTEKITLQIRTCKHSYEAESKYDISVAMISMLFIFFLFIIICKHDIQTSLHVQSIWDLRFEAFMVTV